jgi:hypothetical protein
MKTQFVLCARQEPFILERKELSVPGMAQTRSRPSRLRDARVVHAFPTPFFQHLFGIVLVVSVLRMNP